MTVKKTLKIEICKIVILVVKNIYKKDFRCTVKLNKFETTGYMTILNQTTLNPTIQIKKKCFRGYISKSIICLKKNLLYT